MSGAIALFLETILPGDEAHSLPSGACVDPARPTARDGVERRLEEIEALLDAAAEELGGAGFAALPPPERLKAVERARRRDMRLMTAFIIHVLRLYYTQAEVLRALPAGAVPPFPAGNTLETDDWTLLEPVARRGAIWRSAAP